MYINVYKIQSLIRTGLKLHNKFKTVLYLFCLHVNDYAPTTTSFLSSQCLHAHPKNTLTALCFTKHSSNNFSLLCRSKQSSHIWRGFLPLRCISLAWCTVLPYCLHIHTYGLSHEMERTSCQQLVCLKKCVYVMDCIVLYCIELCYVIL